ncbi:MAG TPA: DUF2807 domain-containing protein [Ohtaekwangia sp.]|nr:DUF2807 domain-containing protein [Ohtaekwangia sp.]
MQAIKKYILLLVAGCGSFLSTAQEISRDLKPFTKIVASPRVNLILEQGDRESIRLVYADVAPERINIEVKGSTLRIYLDDARVVEKTTRVMRRHRESIYRGVSVTAYVTYRAIRHLEIRGHQELTCKSPISAEKFVLKAYGENEIRLASIKTDYLKTSLFGENDLKIRGGQAEFQKYKLFGDNKIDSRALKSFATTTTSFGESRIKLSTQDELKVTAFGDGQVSYNGTARVNRGLMIGRTEIHKLN